jgi:hypothetical protein
MAKVGDWAKSLERFKRAEAEAQTSQNVLKIVVFAKTLGDHSRRSWRPRVAVEGDPHF